MTGRGGRTATLAFAAAIIVAAAGLAVAIHMLLGLLSLQIAVASTSVDGRRAASALAQMFAAEHARVRLRTVLLPDLVSASHALDDDRTSLAIVRSDAAPQDGQTLVILRRDAAMLVAPGGSGIDGVGRLRGATVGFLDGRKLDGRLLDRILEHFGIPPDSVHRAIVGLDAVPEAIRHRRVAAMFVVAPADSGTWRALLAALRKGGEGEPRTIEVDEAAAIAKEHPELDTIDVPKGTFRGALPAPSEDVTTVSVSYRLVARSAVPDWLAGEITRGILTGKPRLTALDDDLAGIEAPDPDDKTGALPIHPGTAAYLSGNLPSVSDQVQGALYWLGLVASAAATLSAVGATLYHRVRPRRPPTRVMRLLEIWLAVRSADGAALDALEGEADAIVDASIRAEAHGRTESAEMRLVTLLATHLHDAVQRRRRRLRDGLEPSAE